MPVGYDAWVIGFVHTGEKTVAIILYQDGRIGKDELNNIEVEV